ncbi:MAG: hypothetical protein ACI9IV_000586 [Paracoccaceae bacterium]|jgi:hypothetical protein
MRADDAEILTLKALTWLASNEDLLPVFLGSSGANTEDFLQRAGDPVFLASVLDFLTMDDAWVMAFCDANGMAYEQPMLARMALPGGALPNWT